MLLRVLKQFLSIVILTWIILRVFQITIGIGLSDRFFKVEIWIFLSLFYVLYFNFKSSKFRFWLSYCIAIIPYVFFNLFYANFERVFKITDFSQFYELIGVLSWMQTIVMMLFVFVVILLVYLNTHFRTRSWLSLFLLLGFLFPAFLSHNYPDSYVQLYKRLGGSNVGFEDKKTVQQNGYYFATYYLHAKQLIARNKLNEDDIERIQASLLPDAFNKNVHIILFESFVDARELTSLEYNIHPVYKKWSDMTDEYTQYYTTPVFGGGTANAEFEILCATKNLKRLNSIEFNMLLGKKMDCLPHMFSEKGYTSITSNGFKPTFFNKRLAYKSLGFDEQHYPSRYLSYDDETYLITKQDDHQHMTDKRFYEDNLKYIKQKIENNESILNFMVPIYGHYPHPVAIEHEKIIEVSNGFKVSAMTLDAINQNYYRTRSLYYYIQDLMVLDPDSIVLVFSDHLPKLEGIKSVKKYGYTHGSFVVPGWVWIDSKLVQIDADTFYDLLPAILNKATQGEYCEINVCKISDEQMLKKYNYLMKQGI